MKKIVLTLVSGLLLGLVVVFIFYVTCFIPQPYDKIFEPYLGAAGFSLVSTLLFGLIARFWQEKAISLVMLALLTMALYAVADWRNDVQMEIWHKVAELGYNTPAVATARWGWMGQFVLSIILMGLCWLIAYKKTDKQISPEAGTENA